MHVVYFTAYTKESESSAHRLYINVCCRPSRHTHLSVIIVLNMVLTDPVSDVLILLVISQHCGPKCKAGV